MNTNPPRKEWRSFAKPDILSDFAETTEGETGSSSNKNVWELPVFV